MFNSSYKCSCEFQIDPNILFCVESTLKLGDPLLFESPNACIEWNVFCCFTTCLASWILQTHANIKQFSRLTLFFSLNFSCTTGIQSQTRYVSQAGWSAPKWLIRHQFGQDHSYTGTSWL